MSAKSREEFERVAGALASSLISLLGESARMAMDVLPTSTWRAIRLTRAAGLLSGYNATMAGMASQLIESQADLLETWRRRNYAHPRSTMGWTPWRETPTMPQLVAASTEQLTQALNIVRTGDVYLRLRDTTYVTYDYALDKLCGEAHAMVSEGFSYAQAIRHVTDEMATVGGVRIRAGNREYDLYGYVRNRVYNDWARFNQAMRYRDGQRMGMDGVEVTAHWDCAPDHQPYQGRVYPLAQFEAIQASLERPIAEGYNCRHMVFPCWADSTQPYSEEQLQEYADQANAIVDVGGSEMTRYEATQWQRGQERRVRGWKTKAQMCDAVGDEQRAAECRREARSIQRELKRTCEEVGLTYDYRRMTVGKLA